MGDLTALLAARIRATGPITLADFMAECLTHPKHGYYTTRQALGAEGDFITAPEISQMFGELLGLALAQAWLDQGSPSAFTLAELGPGRGTLMADALRATAKVPGFHSAAQVVFVEVSPVLRSRQKEAVPNARWIDKAGDLPKSPLFLIANEYFDALPIRQFRREPDGWSERMVGLDGDALAFGWSPAAPLATLAARVADTRPGDIVETCTPAETDAAVVAHLIARHGGAAILVDYGGWTSLGDTFQAVRAHEPTDPLKDPGAADLTAHVAFQPLAQAARDARAEATEMIPQGVLLERLGITPRAQTLARSLTGHPLEIHIAAHRRLTHPDEMGSLFKAMAIHPRTAPPPPGFVP